MRLNIAHSRRASAPTAHPRALPTDVQDVLESPTPSAVALWLAASLPEDVDAQIRDLDSHEVARLVEFLTPASARSLMEMLSAPTAVKLVTGVPASLGAGLLDVLPDDQVSRIVRLLEEDQEVDVLAALPRSRSALLRGLLAWPDESAASWMRPAFLRVDPDSTVGDAVSAARNSPEDLDQGAFVLDTREDCRGQLLGWVSPSALVLEERRKPVAEVMVDRDTVLGWSVVALADQESVIAHAEVSPSGMVPVVDGERLIGVITRESVTDISQEETGEDLALQGGASPLGVPYLQAGPARVWRARVPWLAVLFLAEMYTGTVLRHFEGELEQVVALSFFIPLLIGTGGNVGTQITTTLIRSMGAEGLRLRDVGRVLGKESVTGVMLGVAMGLLGALRAWTLGVGGPVILTVTLALACICLWSSLIAAVLPMVLKRLGVDPAVVSAPLISTVVDGTGLMIYFVLARLIAL